DALSFPAPAAFRTVRGLAFDASLLDPDGPHPGRIPTSPLSDPSYDGPLCRFALITALDVLEHIGDDRDAVRAIAAMLGPGALLLVTVPAFAMLWDHHDDLNQHHRRYTAGRLRRLLDGQGLELLRLRFLFCSLFAPKLMVRLLNAGR